MARKRTKTEAERSEQERWGLPTTSALDHLEDETDALRIVVLGWQWLDSLLWLALSDSLPGANTGGLKEIKMPAKVDVAVGLGLVHPDERPVLRKLNALRNQFVHEQKTGWTRQDSRELAATWSSASRKILREAGVSVRTGDVLHPLRMTVMLQVVKLDSAISGKRNWSTHAAASMEALRMVVKTPREQRPWADDESPSDWVERETQRRIEERRSKGLL